jgi:hypothetical protein
VVPRRASPAAERLDTQVFRAIPPTQLVDRSYSAYISAAARPSRIPPTALVDRSYSAYIQSAARPSRIPPTALVDRSYSAYVRSPEKSLQQRGRQLSTSSGVGRGLP